MSTDPTAGPLARFVANTDTLRRELRRIAKRYGVGSPSFARAVRQLVEAAAPQLATELTTGQLVAWAQAVRQAAAPLRLPALPPADRPPLPPNFGRPGPGDPEPGRLTVLPAVVKAVEWVRTRIPFTQDEYRQLDADAQRVAFTVARVTTLRAVEDVQAAIARDVDTGGTLRQFRRDVAPAVEGALTPAQVETLYRTHVGRAYGAGQQAVLRSPAVASAFPYVRYSATHDSRVRPEHLMMEKLGLNGTAIYRADDPIWDLFWPPWAWNCRCIPIPYSIADAAAEGVREAQDWLRRGTPPAVPHHVEPLPFTIPRGWVPTGRRLASVA